MGGGSGPMARLPRLLSLSGWLMANSLEYAAVVSAAILEMEDAYILISEKKLSSLDQLLPLLEKVVQAGKPLLIIADEVEFRVTQELLGPCPLCGQKRTSCARLSMSALCQKRTSRPWQRSV